MLLRHFRCADGWLIQVHTGAAGAFGRLMTLLRIDGEISPASGPVASACRLTDDDLAVLERTSERPTSRRDASQRPPPTGTYLQPRSECLRCSRRGLWVVSWTRYLLRVFVASLVWVALARTVAAMFSGHA